jgi:hypothetical protein
MLAWDLWPRITNAGIGGVTYVRDSALLAASILLDGNRSVFALTDDNKIDFVGRFSDGGLHSLFDSRFAQASIIRGNRTVLAIRRAKDGRGFAVETLFSSSRENSVYRFHESKQFGQLIRFHEGSLFDWRKRWQRYGPAGFEDIEGGDVGTVELFPKGWFRDLPTLGVSLIQGRERLYLYDGQRITPVRGSEKGVIGQTPFVHELSGIGHVLVTSDRGGFELRRDGSLLPLSGPLGEIYPAYSWILFADWPEAGLALASTRQGLLAIDRDLRWMPVEGAEEGGFHFGGPPFGTVPSTGDLLLSRSGDLYLAIDESRAPDKPCSNRAANFHKHSSP